MSTIGRALCRARKAGFVYSRQAFGCTGSTCGHESDTEYRQFAGHQPPGNIRPGLINIGNVSLTAAIGLKRLAIAAAAILAAAFVTLVALSILIPASSVRDAVQSEIRAVTGLDPMLGPGSLLLLEESTSMPDPQSDRMKSGWSRPIYVLRRGLEFICGYLDKSGSQYAVLSAANGGVKASFRAEDLGNLSRVSGVAVPV